MKYEKPQIGQRYYNLTVIDGPIKRNKFIYYLCQCDCGNKKEIRQDHLKKGETKSCGCLHKKVMRELMGKDLTGQQFGYLTAISINEEETQRHKHGDLFWNCKCKCGNMTVVSQEDLNEGNTKSCGCYNIECLHNRTEDLTGKVFNYLQVISLDKERTENTKHTYWFCKCLKCNSGKIKSISASQLKSGGTKSCGCLKSSYEEKIEAILRENNINYKKQYSFDDLRGDYKKLFFDFAIFDNNNKLKYLIEYNGDQHYKIVEYWGGEEKFLERQRYDNKKIEYCKKNNIPLIILNKKNILDKETIIKEEILNE